MCSDRPCRESETLAVGRAKPSPRRFPVGTCRPRAFARCQVSGWIRSAATLDLRMCLPAASGCGRLPTAAGPRSQSGRADGQRASGAGAMPRTNPMRAVRDDRSRHRARSRAIGVRIGGPARGRAVAHCAVWKLACGFTRAAVESQFCCCCTAWARPAMCGRGGGRCWPGGGRAAGWHRTCPVMAARRRYRATASSPWPPRSPASPTPTPHCRAGALGGRGRRPGPG